MVACRMSFTGNILDIGVTGMQRHREAAHILEEGLKMDPFNSALKAQLDLATQKNVSDLLEGILLMCF